MVASGMVGRPASRCRMDAGLVTPRSSVRASATWDRPPNARSRVRRDALAHTTVASSTTFRACRRESLMSSVRSSTVSSVASTAADREAHAL